MRKCPQISQKDVMWQFIARMEKERRRRAEDVVNLQHPSGHRVMGIKPTFASRRKLLLKGSLLQQTAPNFLWSNLSESSTDISFGRPPTYVATTEAASARPMPVDSMKALIDKLWEKEKDG